MCQAYWLKNGERSMNLKRKVSDQPFRKTQVYLLCFDLNRVDLGFMCQFENIFSTDDVTGFKGSIQYSGSKKAFYTGSKLIADLVKKVSRAKGFSLRVKKTKLMC